MIQIPYPPLIPPDFEPPPPGPVYRFLSCLAVVLLAVEMLLAILQTR